MSASSSPGSQASVRRTPRPVLPAVCVAGAATAALLTVYAGRHNHSRILLLLFVGWVLLPFAAALAGNFSAKTWPVGVRSAILLLPLAALPVYAASAFGFLTAKLGFVFLAFPAASWLLLAVAATAALLLHGRLR